MRSTRCSSGTTRAAAARRRAVRYAISLLVQRFHHHGDIVGHFAFDAGNREPELAHGIDIFRVGQRGAVRIAGAFEAAVFRALAGVRDHDGRPAWAEAFGGQTVGVGKFARVVAVGFDHVPAEGKPVVHVGRGHDFEDRAVDAEAVVVQGDHEVLHAEMAGEIACFVGHAFLGLGIARDHEGAGGETARAVQGGEAQTRGDAVAGGTGGSVGEGVMALDVAAGSAPFAEAGEILGVDRHAGEVGGKGFAIAAQRLIDERQQRVK